MRKRFLPPLFLLLAAMGWSLGGVLIKSVHWHPIALAGARSAIAIPILLLFMGRPRFTFSRAQIGGALALAVTIVLFVFATRMTTAANAIFLQYTAPIYVAIIGRWYLGEDAHPIDWLVIVVALVGIALFFIDRLTVSGFWGNILALTSGLTFAALVLFLRKERGGLPSVVLGNAIVVAVSVPFMFGMPMGQGDLWRVIILGIFQLAFPYVVYSLAIKHVTALEAILIPLVEPILNPLWVMLALGERPGRWAIVGGALVLGAVLVRSFVMVRRRRSLKSRTPS